MERIKVFKAMVGSHNYNLNTVDSDKDYKEFVLPTFDDLYENNTFSKSSVGESEDVDMHDIRKLPQLLYKSNLNFTEVLFSNEISLCFNETNAFMKELIELRDEIAAMNLPYLYHACKGMHFTKIKRIESATSGTQHLLDKYGYDTKQALHAFRILDFAERFSETGFKNLRKAMTYSDDEREKMLSIKHGHYKYEEIRTVLDKKEQDYNKLKEKFCANTVNEDLNHHIKEVVKKTVKIGISE